MYDEKKIEDSLKACKEAKTIYASDFFKNPRNVFDLDTFLPAAQEEEYKNLCKNFGIPWGGII